MTDQQEENPLINPAIVADAKAVKTKTAAAPKSAKKPVKDSGGFTWGTGRRKSSIARVRIRPGKGDVQVNKNLSMTTLPNSRTETR